MQTVHPTIRQGFIACLVIAPLLQLIGDILWQSHSHPYAWSLWREASYIFFIPVGFLLASRLAVKSATWAVVACGVFVVGCFGVATMMPLFRLGAFYPIEGHNEFPVVVQSILDKGTYAVTLFLPGLCFPVSFLVFGIGFLKHRIFPAALSIAFIAAGIFFWLGNAVELDPVMIACDVWFLVIFCWAGNSIFKQGASKTKTRLSFDTV